MKVKSNLLSIFMTGFLLIAQLLHPMPVFADGEITPSPTDTPAPTSTAEYTPTAVVPSETSTLDPSPEASPTSPTPTTLPIETATLDPSPEASTASPTATPPPVETATPEPVEPTVESSPPADPVDTSTPTVEAPTPAIEPTTEVVETTTPADADSVDEQSLPEVVSEFAGETSVVILDEMGQPLSLSTQAAAEAFVNGDPMWCPDGVVPGGAGCTSSYLTMNDLLASEVSYINSQNVNGTIWITSGPVGDGSPIIINGCLNFDFSTNTCVTYANWANYTLTLQGGWDGTSGSTTIGSNSIFSVPINILDWNNTVTINNITVDGASGSGLGVTTNGKNVNISDSSFINSRANYTGTTPFPWGDGADIFTNGGDITIRRSRFDGNEWDGIYVVNAGQIDIQDSTMNGNLIGGLDTVQAAGINVANTEFTGNLYYDLLAYCDTGIPPGYLNLLFPDNQNLDFVVDSNCSINNNIGQAGTPPPARSNPGGGYFTPPFGSQVSFILNCSNQSSFLVNLPNGDKVEIVCPVRGRASIKRLDNTILPGELPAGYIYASAFQVDITKIKQPEEMVNGEFLTEPVDVITEGGYIKVSFVTLASQIEKSSTINQKSYTILFWEKETNQWIPLKDFVFGRSFRLFPENPEDERIIRSGVFINTGEIPPRVEVSTNFPGIFVLVER